MLQAIVTNEYYQIAHTVSHNHEEPLTGPLEYSQDLYYEAFRLSAELKKPVTIQRVTEWKIAKRDIDDLESVMFFFDFEDAGDYLTGQTVTGEKHIGPEHFSKDVELSRYNPVNGWVIPETTPIFS